MAMEHLKSVRQYCNEWKSAIYSFEDYINKEYNMKSVSRSSGSEDKAPDSQWTNASSNLERRLFLILQYYRSVQRVKNTLSF